jgi:hypothetical protein
MRVSDMHDIFKNALSSHGELTLSNMSIPKKAVFVLLINTLLHLISFTMFTQSGGPAIRRFSLTVARLLSSKG